MIAGVLIMGVLALIALVFTALLLVSAWSAMREELLPTFRIDPPSPSGLALALIGMLLPVMLIILFTGSLAAWIIGLLLEPH